MIDSYKAEYAIMRAVSNGTKAPSCVLDAIIIVVDDALPPGERPLIVRSLNRASAERVIRKYAGPLTNGTSVNLQDLWKAGSRDYHPETTLDLVIKQANRVIWAADKDRSAAGDMLSVCTALHIERDAPDYEYRRASTAWEVMVDVGRNDPR